MSFGVTRTSRLDDGTWVMEFFDARSQFTFCDLLRCLRELGAPFQEAPDPPPDGFSIATT
jgi:hypothetical protein